MFARIATRTGVQLPSPPAPKAFGAATPEQSVGGPTRSQCVGAARLRLGRPAFVFYYANVAKRYDAAPMPATIPAHVYEVRHRKDKRASI